MRQVATLSRVAACPDLAPASTWRWRDRYGKPYHPSEMETRHVFFTLRMIWNHTMPRGARLHPYRPYNFGPFYSRDYFAKAIEALVPELERREDLKASWQADLQWMQDWLARQRPQLELAA